jgi:hypothetical protein
MTVEDARKLLPTSCTIGKWYHAEWRGHKCELMLTWSKRYRRTFIHARYLVDSYYVFEDGTRKYKGQEYRTFRETLRGSWKEIG